jgi:UDP-glucose 4-epimerase
MPKILVTGGCGFVGSNLVDLLVEDEENEVLVIDNLDTGKKEHCNDRAKYIFADIRNVFSCSVSEAALKNIVPKHYANFLRNVDVVYHLAALARIQPSFNRPAETISVNSFGTSLVCKYAHEVGAKVVYSGSSTFYGGVYLNPYAFSKWQGEQALKMYSEIYGLNTAIARFFNVYGPRHPGDGQFATVVAIFEQQVLKGENLTIVGDGEQRRDFTHVTDICEGLIAISKGEYRADAFNLGTGVNHSINELSDFFGIEKTYLDPRPGEARNTLADIEETTKLTGWTPTIKLEDYIEDWMRENK